MIRLLDRHWFLTSTSYGTWLPGDERGFVGPVVNESGEIERHNIPGEPYDADIPELAAEAPDRLKCAPISLNSAQARAVCDQFLTTAEHRGWLLLAASVMWNHFHSVLSVPGDPEPSTLLGNLKAYASRTLSEGWDKPDSETWWTEGGSKRKLPDEFAVRAAVRYTLNQHGMLASYVHPEVPGEWWKTKPGERWA